MLNRTLDDTQGFPGVVVSSCWFERSVADEKVVGCMDHFLFAPMKKFPIEGNDKCTELFASVLLS